MERITESKHNIRTDKANHLEYDLTFTISEKTEGLESINVQGIKAGNYIFNINKDVLNDYTNVSFTAGFDYAILTDVLSEIEVIKAEYQTPVEED